MIGGRSWLLLVTRMSNKLLFIVVLSLVAILVGVVLAFLNKSDTGYVERYREPEKND